MDTRSSSAGQGSSRAQGSAGVQVVRPAAPATQEADEDSDRPEWAGGNPDLNDHAGAGTGNPSSGTTKGDVYGDIVRTVRGGTGEKPPGVKKPLARIREARLALD